MAERRPNALSLEALGRGGLYSLNYDRALGDSVSLGAGISYLGVNVGPAHASVFVFPVYANAYLTSGPHRPYFTMGLSVIHANTDLSEAGGMKDFALAGATAPLLTVGAGYELRARSGFLLRVSPYWVLPVNLPWVGLSVGGTF